jgi:hypothetical protein
MFAVPVRAFLLSYLESKFLFRAEGCDTPSVTMQSLINFGHRLRICFEFQRLEDLKQRKILNCVGAHMSVSLSVFTVPSTRY